jgi:hypothetical protein
LLLLRVLLMLLPLVLVPAGAAVKMKGSGCSG